MGKDIRHIGYFIGITLLMPHNTPTKIELNDFIKDFIVEAEEHSLAIEYNLLMLEKKQEKIPIINELFRSFHTIKGLSISLNLNPIIEISRKAETILSLLRDKKIVTTPEIINTILCANDSLRLIINDLRNNKPDAMETRINTKELDSVISLRVPSSLL